MKILETIPIDQRPEVPARPSGRRNRYYDFATQLMEAYKEGKGINIAVDDSPEVKGILGGGSLGGHLRYRYKLLGDKNEYRVRVQVNQDKTAAFIWIERVG